MRDKLKKLKRYIRHRKTFSHEICGLVIYYLSYAYMVLELEENHGEYASVSFDQQIVYDRYDCCHDVMGFYHTHPPGFRAQPSQVDIVTMGAWQRCLGVPLWCFIDCGWDIKCYLFYEGEKYREFRYKSIEMSSVFGDGMLPDYIYVKDLDT